MKFLKLPQRMWTNRVILLFSLQWNAVALWAWGELGDGCEFHEIVITNCFSYLSSSRHCRRQLRDLSQSHHGSLHRVSGESGERHKRGMHCRMGSLQCEFETLAAFIGSSQLAFVARPCNNSMISMCLFYFSTHSTSTASRDGWRRVRSVHLTTGSGSSRSMDIKVDWVERACDDLMGASWWGPCRRTGSEISSDRFKIFSTQISSSPNWYDFHIKIFE